MRIQCPDCGKFFTFDEIFECPQCGYVMGDREQKDAIEQAEEIHVKATKEAAGN